MINPMFAEMNTTMGGGGANGVTMWQYLLGMSSYASNNGGYTMFIDTVRENNNAVDDDFKMYIQMHRPVALFLNGYNISTTGLRHHGTHDFVDLTEYAGGHIMVAYGYQEVFYYDANGVMFRTDMYARVHTGSSIGWTRINTHSTLDAAWVTHLY
jgi:hypothetical protein